MHCAAPAACVGRWRTCFRYTSAGRPPDWKLRSRAYSVSSTAMSCACASSACWHSASAATIALSGSIAASPAQQLAVLCTGSRDRNERGFALRSPSLSQAQNAESSSAMVWAQTTCCVAGRQTACSAVAFAARRTCRRLCLVGGQPALHLAPLGVHLPDARLQHVPLPRHVLDLQQQQSQVQSVALIDAVLCQGTPLTSACQTPADLKARFLESWPCLAALTASSMLSVWLGI
jgi:hypothetical protein